METMRLRTTIACALVAVLGIGQIANPQQSGQTGSKAVWRNSKAGAVVARRPGAMVQRGMGRFRNAHNDFLDRARSGPNITDTAADRPVKTITQLKADAIRIIFDNLTALILAANAQQRIDAGLSPVNPSPATGVSGTSDLSALLGSISGSG